MLTSLALVSAILVSTQDPMMPAIPKAELDAISYLAGKYKGTGTMSDPTGNVMKVTGTSNGVMELGRWFNLYASYDMGQEGTLEGRMMLTYNASKKRYEGVWCDNFSEYAIRANGYTEGKYFVLFTEEFEMMPGMKTILKIVYSKESSRTYNYSMKMKSEETWIPMMSMSYKK